MQHLPAFRDPNLLVGPEHFSDAGVYRLDDETAIVQTVDFFPPVVNDPYLFGRIAAANALSDVYAMAGTPRTALNIVGFPDRELPLEILQEILRGGAERVEAAGAVIVGGHSTRDEELKYGLAVTGVVHPDRVMTNAAAQAGDVLVLTKGLGTGFMTTAYRAGRCDEAAMAPAWDSMVALNRVAAEAAVAAGAHAMTDVTGFGLAGHGMELATASDVCLHIELGRLPLLDGAEAYADPQNFSASNRPVRAFLGDRMRFDTEAAESPRAELLFDPQTSGGLLIAVPREGVDTLLDRCEAAAVIGAVERGGDVRIVVAD